MIPTSSLSEQKSLISVSGNYMATHSHQLSSLALIRPQARVDSLATQHLFTASLSHRPLPVPTMPMQVLSLLLPDSSSRRPLTALSVSGRLKRGLAWLFIKDTMGRSGTSAGVHLAIILPPVAVTRQFVFGLKITSPTFA